MTVMVMVGWWYRCEFASVLDHVVRHEDLQVLDLVAMADRQEIARILHGQPLQ
jgi:hypothetical protein